MFVTSPPFLTIKMKSQNRNQTRVFDLSGGLKLQLLRQSDQGMLCDRTKEDPCRPKTDTAFNRSHYSHELNLST